MSIGPSVSALLQRRTSLTSESLVGLQELTSESYDEVMTLNLRSVMESCAVAIPHPIETPGQRDRRRIARGADGHHLHLASDAISGYATGQIVELNGAQLRP